MDILCFLVLSPSCTRIHIQTNDKDVPLNDDLKRVYIDIFTKQNCVLENIFNNFGNIRKTVISLNSLALVLPLSSPADFHTSLNYSIICG